MFVAVWRWDPKLEAWETTDESINLDHVDRLYIEPDNIDPLSGEPEIWNVTAVFAGGDEGIEIAMGAPTRDDCRMLIGVMLDQTEVGRWPGPQTVGGATSHLAEPPGRN